MRANDAFDELDNPNEARKRRNRPSRSKGLRTRTGCVPCRSRHVKCDEGRPTCRACQKGQRQCTWDGSGNRGACDHAPSDEAVHSLGGHFHALQTPPAAGSVLQGQKAPLQTFVDGTKSPHLQQKTFFTRLGAAWEPTDAQLLSTSPDSTWSGGQSYTAEAAPLRWLGLLAHDASRDDWLISPPNPSPWPGDYTLPHGQAGRLEQVRVEQHPPPTPRELVPPQVVYNSGDEVSLSSQEIPLLRHFIERLSTWIDVTDPDRSFSTLVPQMALRSRGLMTAMLALSSRHLAFDQKSSPDTAVQYYHDTLQYLQHEMKKTTYLTSDELLATVLIISTYEMIDGLGKGWERHLKGVFWIQRSQLIHGESQGLKKCIWWAWLRQDIWAAFKERRKILSFYTLTRPCCDLAFWELVNRAVFLFGQCVNYASNAEADAGRLNVQARLERAERLQASLTEWYLYFKSYDCRLPAPERADEHAFQPIWINPPAASIAMQVHYTCKLLLLDNMPATGGLRELAKRTPAIDEAIDTICGIACCTSDEAAMLVSVQCVYAAGLQVRGSERKQHTLDLLRQHRGVTKWPPSDLEQELQDHWSS
ncbi:hypothetical protein LTR85_003765 [Meristemomyces frigidus]|nr:hypothetical protein LTR85_003765 [Meristemomyces frigidus]